MKQNQTNPLATLSAVGEGLYSLVVFGALWLAGNGAILPDKSDEFLALRLTVKSIVLIAFYLLMWFFSMRTFDAISLNDSRPLLLSIIRYLLGLSVYTATLSLLVATSRSGSVSIRLLPAFWLVMASAGICIRLLTRVLGRWFNIYRHELKHVIIVGSGPRGQRYFDMVKHREDMCVLGFVDVEYVSSTAFKRPVTLLGDLGQLESVLMKTRLDEVVIALPMRSMYNHIRVVLETCERMGVSAKLLSDLFEFPRMDQRYQVEHAHSMLHFRVFRIQEGHLVLKRSIDLIGAALGLVLLSPALMLIAIAVKVTSGGPVLFWQERYGLNKRLFKMCKFRTMVANAEVLQNSLESQNEASGPVFKMRNDPRVSPLGRVLRSTSLDELPQLFNVLKGEMSLVGPRPLPKRDVSRFSEAHLMRRFCVRPGITCLWQVNGRSNTDFSQWIDLDLQYIDGWSLGLDMQILAKTLPAVLKRTGAS